MSGWMNEATKEALERRAKANEEYRLIARPNLVEHIANVVKALAPNAATLSWGWSWESDDEGGSNAHLSDASIDDVDGNYIGEVEVKRKSRWSDEEYVDELASAVRDALDDISGEIEELFDTDDITINLVTLEVS